jgi:hypothetical protein
LKSKLKNHNFETVENIHKNCDQWAKNTHRKWLSVLLRSMERTLKPLCNFPRVVLWRR